MNDNNLKLENQLCFPLYASAKEVIRKYQPFLDKLDLTYTQYIAMMVLWEKIEVTVKGLGDTLFLDSGTLTPMLKKMEVKGLIRRERSKQDERIVVVTLTDKGRKLKEEAREVPQKIGSCIQLEENDAKELYRILHILLDKLK